MTEDWAGVARAINERMANLGLTQLDLVKRSHVSKTMVAEIRHNSVQRRRSARTMEALSEALEWHPGHLDAILRGERNPGVGEPLVRTESDTPSRLAAIEYRLDQMNEQLNAIADFIKTLAADRANTSFGSAESDRESRTRDGRPWNQ